MMVFKLSKVEELKKTYKDFDIYIQCIQCTQNQNIVLYYDWVRRLFRNIQTLVLKN